MAYPKNDSNVYDDLSAKLKFALSTNFSTRIYARKLAHKSIFILNFFVYVCH